MRSYDEVVLAVVGFLNKKAIPYVVVGGFSVAVFGSPRTTQDVDFLMMLRDEDVDELVSFLKSSHFGINADDVKSAFREKSHFTVFDEDSVFQLDIKGIYTDFDRRTLERRVKVKLADGFVWVGSPEDMILCKLEFGSEKDLSDVKGVLARQKNLDFDYIKKFAKKTGTYDLFLRLAEEVRQQKL